MSSESAGRWPARRGLLVARPAAPLLPALAVLAAAALAAGGAAAASAGGKKWLLLVLAVSIVCCGLAAWLLLFRRFVELATFFLAASVPIYLDVEIFAPSHPMRALTAFPPAFNLRLQDLLLAVLGVVWIYEIALGRARPSARLGWAGRWWALFLAAGLLFPVHSIDPVRSAFAWSELLRYSLVFVYLAKRLDQRALLRWVVFALAGAVWLQVLVGAAQQALGGPIGLDFLGEGGQVVKFGLANSRVSGLMHHPNHLALFLNLVGPLMLAQVLVRQAAWIRLFYALTFLALNVLLLLTFSRAGYFCGALGALATFHWMLARRGHPRLVSIWLPVLAGIVLFTTLFIAYEPFRVRLTADDGGSTASRFQQWRTALNVIRHLPFAGTGIASYIQGSWDYNRGEGTFTNVLFRVHNGSLLVTAEMGLFASLGYHGWIFCVLKRGWRGWRERDDLVAAVATGAAVGVAMWFLKSMYNVDTPMDDNVLWLVAALPFAARNVARRLEVESPLPAVSRPAREGPG